MNIEWICSSSIMILSVMLIRFLFRKKVQPRICYAMWAAVALRLLIPVSFSGTAVSVLNLLPGEILEESSESKKTVNEMHEAGQEGLTPGIDIESKPVKEPNIQAQDRVNVQSKQKEKQEDSASFSGKGEGADTGRLLRYGWLACAALWGSVLLTVNLNYGRRLKRSRKRVREERLPMDCKIPVYTSEMIRTPFLSGLLHPAVYVTEQVVNEKEAFSFVLCHEQIHRRQHDNWWVLVRNLCLCLHWYNPLVWMAACLSRLDGELACDEKVLEQLGRKAGADYGRTLLEIGVLGRLSIDGWRISATMGGNKRLLRRRLQMIAAMPEKNTGMKILMMILMSLILAVTFTGRAGISFAASEKGSSGIREEQKQSFAEVFRSMQGSMEEALQEEVLERKMVQMKEPFDIEEEPETGELISRKIGEDGCISVIYYRYDEYEQLHMIRYVEENTAPDAIFERLDLTYVDDGGVYTLPAVADGTDRIGIMIGMAKKSLEELYLWTGEKVDTACFQISNVGGVIFGLTPEDIIHSRFFLSRDFGRGTNADPEYNLFDCISSITVVPGRRFWFSPVLWHIFPRQMEEMTDEEVIIWYLERIPMLDECKVKRVEKNDEDTWTVQIQSGEWFEVAYDANIREIIHVIGPYSGYPVH